MGLDTTIPLSPQWLITKSCDGKPPTCAMVSVTIKYPWGSPNLVKDFV